METADIQQIAHRVGWGLIELQLNMDVHMGRNDTVTVMAAHIIRGKSIRAINSVSLVPSHIPSPGAAQVPEIVKGGLMAASG